MRFETKGFLAHMDIAFPAESEKAARAIVKGLARWAKEGWKSSSQGPCSCSRARCRTKLFQQETTTAKPGRYVQACFMETQDWGAITCAWGMEPIFRIVK